ncbi:ABC transporter ATP-binding protein [Tabrizicola sp.]|uniref:ABC transporter ATP-binding protein n=1 Tax=Tabrizicola sp. TaxID=2005166 RepID=UPI00286C892B|nr:ABC transporter ATP-binding protein [Tabrizicola sp.]
MHSVSVKNVSLNFGAASVLKNMNLDVEEGEFIVLLGPSGCGKSTLLNCLAGLLELSEGQIFIKGKNVTWAEPSERGIGMVFQSYALYPQMTVRGNLSFGLKIAGLPKEEIQKRVERASEILQIGPLLDRKPGALSGGQRQRVAIGRALVRDVDVFLFDEPLSNLDAKLRGELRVEIKRLHERLKNTMVYVTHDQIEALTLADRIAVMKGGVIQQLDDPQTIYNRPSNLFVAGFIGSPSMNMLHGEIKNGVFHGKDDLLVDLRGYEGGTQVDRAKAILGFRPEHITIVDTAEPGRTIPAIVEIDEHLGADALLWLEAAGQQVCVRIPVEGRLAAGTKVHLRLDMGKASIFDSVNEQRV